ncbi:hypothetical protein KIW84_053015 [Lathyrus oleraceus]|uniref:Uncharacterized protein n=1 Tax=Pisum sativum TaxID=3888 RepID=A0A9D4WP66_PEA|nr:hypothetical protein KIW84_053015 [Pisum sativum]
MSKEFDTNLLGVTRPPPESCDERGKRLKLEEESESESESESEQELESDSEQKGFPYWDYTTKPYEDLVYEDFSSRFDNNPIPFRFRCSRFYYRNKAQIKKDDEEAKAVAEYLRDSANISPFDAIPVPPLANVSANNFPKPITTMNDDARTCLTELSKLSLKTYNNDQGSDYQFHNLVKACRCHTPFITYYITFEAKDAATHVDPFNSPIITFQAQVWKRFTKDGPPIVDSCSIKT